MAFDPMNHPDHLTIESPVGSVYLSWWDQADLEKVVYVLVDTEAHRVGFGG